MSSSLIRMPSEPDLACKVSGAGDRLNIRNIIYTAWSLFNSQGNAASGYHVRQHVLLFVTKRFLTFLLHDRNGM